MSKYLIFVVVVGLAACGDSAIGESPGGHVDASGDSDGSSPQDAADAAPDAYVVPQYAELWYAVDDLLVYIDLLESDGTVETTQVSTVTNDLDVGHNMLTMLDDGSLLGARLSNVDSKTYFYYIATPPRDGSDVTVTELGVMPDDLMLEGLYTDCDGRLYAMDTGADVGSSTGNRLLRFTGDVLASDFSYVVVSDLATADVADIDDLGPGITDNEITDNPGLAIDTGAVYDFNYETGSGTQVGSGGSWGIHALGANFFADNKARLYVLDSAANLYELDSQTFVLSSVLWTGPTPGSGHAGWSGLAGPLTDCETGFVIE